MTDDTRELIFGIFMGAVFQIISSLMFNKKH